MTDTDDSPEARHVDAYLAMIDRLENDIVPVDRDAALASIAVSLKRIADALERANLNGDILANVIEGAIFRGLHSDR